MAITFASLGLAISLAVYLSVKKFHQLSWVIPSVSSEPVLPVAK
jgi:hypothetical protein